MLTIKCFETSKQTFQTTIQRYRQKKPKKWVRKTKKKIQNRITKNRFCKKKKVNKLLAQKCSLKFNNFISNKLKLLFNFGPIELFSPADYNKHIISNILTSLFNFFLFRVSKLSKMHVSTFLLFFFFMETIILLKIFFLYWFWCITISQYLAPNIWHWIEMITTKNKNCTML